MEGATETPVDPNAAVAVAVEAPKAPKIKRARTTTRLFDAGGGSIEVVAEELKNGTFQAYAKHRVRNVETGEVDKDASKGRGVVSQHATYDEAKRAAEAITSALTKGAWKLKPASGTAGKSSFTMDSLPKAKK